MVELLNEYKNAFEVDLIMERGSDFLRRQKGQLKLDNSILEEFFIHLVHEDIIDGLGDTEIVVGPRKAFMSLSFRPRNFSSLDQKPDIVLKTKDQDFVIGAQIRYKFSTDPNFSSAHTTADSLVLAVLAAEIKTNLDKSMFQEAAGTASRLKMGCSSAKYFVVAEYLDMRPEDPRLTDIDNAFVLRRTKRLSSDKRGVLAEVRKQHNENPIDADVVWKFVQEIQGFVNATWYDPDEVLRYGSFI